MALNLNSIGKKIGPITKEYNWKDVVLYALGVGAGFDELDYCYEHRLKVIPSFSIASVYEFLAEAGLSSEADLTGILHGEQDIVFHNPIPTEGKITTEGSITNMYDKGADTGALVVAEADTYHSNGQKLFTNYFTLFCRKDGGFGGPDAPQEPVEFPDRAPDLKKKSFQQWISLCCTGSAATSSSSMWIPISHGPAASISRSCTDCAPTVTPAAQW